MKKYFILFIIALVSVFAGCQGKNDKKLAFEYEYKHYANPEVVEALKWEWFDSERYNSVFEEHVFEKSTFEEIKEKMEGKGKTYIYFGYNPKLYQCPYCAIILPIANEAALRNGVDKILYLDIYQMRKDNTEEYKWLKEFITNQIPDFGEKILVPDYYVIEDGQILSHHIATLPYEKEDGSTGYLKDLTPEQIKEIENIFDEMFKE